MNIIFQLLFHVTFIIKTSQTDVNQTSVIVNNETIKKKPQDNEVNYDRFVQDLDDEEWHVAHLKHEFEGRRDCMGETFADKIKKYRRTLRNDASLIMYVSAEPLPYNESDIYEDSCDVDLKDARTVSTFKLTPITTIKMDDQTEFVDSMSSTVAMENETHIEMTDATLATMTSPMNATATSASIDFKATTASMTPKQDDYFTSKKGEEDIKKDDDKKNRRGDYMFSSVEYYDDEPEFDVNICPDVIEVIDLQIDQLRKYDVECEKMIEWRSLHAP